MLHLELMPEEEKILEAPPPKTIVVRYGYLREIGEFVSELTGKVGCGTKLIIRTDRGTEVAEMLTTTCGNGGCGKSITRDKLLSYIESSGGKNYPFSESGRVLRVASAQDLAEQSKLDEHRKKHVDMARELVVRHNLAMKIVDVEHVLGGERVLFYFTAEQRIDFRSLVRDLAHELHTRIELRQVGARDEARLVADYEKCGQHCCCKQFLKVLTPISMRSAKVQKATLDPTKISGRCGRLMCCLRYEDATYEELKKKLPRRNTRVKTEQGDCWVIDGQILTQLVLVQYDDGKREAVPMEKVLEFDRPKPQMPDGRIMQTPNDRPPMPAGEMGNGGEGRGRAGGRNGPPRGAGFAGGAVPGRRERPQPGSPARGPEGDPLAERGPTGGDLNDGGEGDGIDELIADAMDESPLPPPAVGDGPVATEGPEPVDDPRATMPEGPALPKGPMPPKPPGRPGGNAPRGKGRPPQGPRQHFQPPRQGGPGRGMQSFRPPQKPGGKGPSPGQNPPDPAPRPAEGSASPEASAPPQAAPPLAPPPPPAAAPEPPSRLEAEGGTSGTPPSPPKD